LFSLPAILVPYQYAWRYQKVNAQYLVTHQAAIEIDADKLSQRLYPTISALLADPNRLAEMSRAMHALAHSQAAEVIAAVLREMVSEKSGREAQHA
jgi:UDP-N-acetylglucosamine--N-acetylmuramyl-(pentapeptide) pyrophosphoryl-undecaprenol N-acetylglucosamine transferase